MTTSRDSGVGEEPVGDTVGTGLEDGLGDVALAEAAGLGDRLGDGRLDEVSDGLEGVESGRLKANPRISGPFRSVSGL